MMKKLIITIVALSFAGSMYAAKITEGFEDKTVLKKWEIEGDAVISPTQKHGGKSALFTPAGSLAVFRFAPENKFGTISMWVYDSGNNSKESSVGKAWNGPYFGLINSDDDKLLLRPVWRPYMKPFGWAIFLTAENQMFSPNWSSVSRKASTWIKVTFSFPDEKTIGATFDDEKEAKQLPEKVEFFNKGANGVAFAGGDDLGENNETFFFDDIEIDVKDAPKAPKK